MYVCVSIYYILTCTVKIFLCMSSPSFLHHIFFEQTRCVVSSRLVVSVHGAQRAAFVSVVGRDMCELRKGFILYFSQPRLPRQFF